MPLAARRAEEHLACSGPNLPRRRSIDAAVLGLQPEAGLAVVQRLLHLGEAHKWWDMEEGCTTDTWQAARLKWTACTRQLRTDGFAPAPVRAEMETPTLHPPGRLFECFPFPGSPGRIRVREVETEQRDLVRVNVLGQRPAFQEEAEEGSKGFVAQFQRVEGQRVRLLVLLRVELHRTVTRPVRRLEGERGADVLRDTAVRGEAQRADQTAGFPDCEGEPVRDAVHRVQDHAASCCRFQEVRWDLRRAVEHQAPLADQVHAREARRVREAVRRVRRLSQDPTFCRLRTTAREDSGDQRRRVLGCRLTGRLQHRGHIAVRVRQ